MGGHPGLRSGFVNGQVADVIRVSVPSRHDPHRPEFHGRSGGALALPRLTSMPPSVRARRSGGLAPLLAILLALAVASSACGSGASPETKESLTRSATVTELRNVSELVDRFNQDAGQVRLILLISPT